MRIIVAAATAACILLPITAFADDASYCKTLSETYRSVVGSNAAAAGNVPEAMAGCATNPAASIPVLEKALQDNKVTLPKRE